MVSPMSLPPSFKIISSYSSLPMPDIQHSPTYRSRCEWRELVLADCVGFAALFSAWAQDGSWATSTFSCFSFFTVLANDWQYLAGPFRRVTFPKNKFKKLQEEDDKREESRQEGAVLFHSRKCCGNAA